MPGHLRRHFSGRTDPFTSAILVFPLFLTYQLGILVGVRGHNGVDFITSRLIRLCNSDPTTYVRMLAAMICAYGMLLLWLRRRGSFHPRAFAPLLLEAFVYAFFMGAVIQLVISHFVRVIPLLLLGDPTPHEILVISAGAGLHEELVFRMLLMGGLIRVLSLPLGGWLGSVLALALSSLLFSAVHHIGPAGEPFTATAFVFRSLAGVIFGSIYWLRGFAVAAWTHTLYDVLVFSLR